MVIDLVDGWVHDFLYDSIDQPGADQLVGTITPRATGIQVSAKLFYRFCVLGVKGRFIVMGKHLEGKHMFAIKVDKEGNLGAVFPFLDHDPLS